MKVGQIHIKRGIYQNRSNYNSKSRVCRIHSPINQRSRKTKKSQATLFIIIGIVIILIGGIILYIRSQSIDPNPPIKVESDSVKTYVEKCLFDLSEDALVNIGLQGGYIEFEEIDTVSAIYDPFNSQSISVMDNSLFIPYWYYQDNQGIDKSEMPPLHKQVENDYSIQWQLENYIRNNLNNCLNNFEVFESQGMNITIAGTIEPHVKILDESVEVTLVYPLHIKKIGKNYKSEKDFAAEVPVRLGKVYQLAKEIRDYEMDNAMLERNTMNLLTIYSEIDDQYLPPMYGGLEFEMCSKRIFWLYNNVYSDVKEMLTANIPYLKIENSEFDPIEITKSAEPNDNYRELRQGIFDNMVHKVSENSYSGVGVDFEYNYNYPLELDFGSYGLLEPAGFEIDMLFSQICMFEYQFAYNLKYPVMVTLKDSKSTLKNNDFLFQFPMQVILKDNNPRVRYSDVYPEAPREIEESVCDKKYWLSGDVTFDITDYDQNPISDVNVYFQCGPSMLYDFEDNGSLNNASVFAEKCFIGSTKNGILQTKLPQCKGGGIVELKKNDYLSRVEFIGDTPVYDESRTINFSLDRVYEKKVSLKKFFVKPAPKDESNPGPNPGIFLDGDYVTQCNIEGSSQVIQPYENAIIRLTKLDPENGILRMPSIVYYEPQNTSTIYIAPGNYFVDIMFIRNERYNGEMTIEKESETRTIPGGPLKPDEVYRYPDQDVLLPTAFTGGAQYNLTVTRDMLERSELITFYVIEEGPPKILEEIGRPLDHLSGCSELNYEKIKARFT